MNVCKWYMSGSATENSILLSVLPRLNKIFNHSINQHIESMLFQNKLYKEMWVLNMKLVEHVFIYVRSILGKKTIIYLDQHTHLKAKGENFERGSCTLYAFNFRKRNV